MSGPHRDTIFALSSGAPPAAIAVLRLSGPAAATALATLAGRLPVPRRATLATLRDAAGGRLDRALVLWFPGVATATGEDLAELHLHGGRAIVAAVLAALGAVPGCRPARAGEFTRRAFENGRIDLLQAEGLADLLQAETEGARRRALRLAEGGLSRVVEGWRARLFDLSARAEAVLEYGADDPDIPADRALPADIAALRGELAGALAAPPAERLRDGVRVVVAGPANAGKSTLVNALAGREVALATPVAGTTRDLIEAPIVLDGRALVLVDSAGLRSGGDVVERLGIARAERAIAGADLLLWLGAPERTPAAPARLILHPRCDQAGRDALPPGADLAVSAVTGAGLAALRARLGAAVDALAPEDATGWTQAHAGRLRAAEGALAAAIDLDNELLAAEQLRLALRELDTLTGRYDVEAMLDRLFGRFCLGK